MRLRVPEWAVIHELGCLGEIGSIGRRVQGSETVSSSSNRQQPLQRQHPKP